MSTSALNQRGLAHRGRDYYDDHLRAKLEPQYNGKFLALELDSGDYEMGDTQLEALDRAEAKHPNSVFYIHRIGYRTAARIGAQLQEEPA